MGPLTSNGTAKSPGAYSSAGNDQSAKSGQSKFDQMRQKSKGPEASAPGAPDGVLPAQQADQIRSAGAAPLNPAERVQQTLALNRQELSRLRQRVDASPKTASLQGISNKLVRVENQYTELNSAFKAMPPNATPQQWMILQQKVYDVSESVGMLSKIVDQASSSVKTVLQTQV